MDLDDGYIGPLIDDWLERLQEAVKEQEALIKSEDEFYMPFIGIPPPIIRAIFKISQHLELSTHTKYLAIHIYDHFMYNYFWKIYKTEFIINPTETSWNKICKTISNQSKLYLVSCLQLASKMDSHSRALNVPQISCILDWIDEKRTYTNDIIMNSELKVFKTINYKMPFYTPLHSLEILLAATGLRHTENMYEISMDLLDLTYLQHDVLYSHTQHLTKGSIAKSEHERANLMALETNVLFLGGSIVLCATFFLSLDDNVAKGIATKLGELIDINDNDIWDMANILLTIII